MDKSIFDLHDVSDLPEKHRDELKLLSIREDAQKLLSLFDIKPRLSIDEIIVGLYRAHKMEKAREWVSATLYNLSKKGLIAKVKGTKGVYEKGTSP